MDKRILVTGANGQLGSELRTLAAQGAPYRFLFTDTGTLDIGDREAVLAFLHENRPEYIVNCAAYTAVDQAEDEPELCYRINRDAVGNLADGAARTGARIVHVSTDYVFDGTHHTPYREDDAPAPDSVYGRSKYEGELRLLAACPQSVILRTAWLYSASGRNFVKTMLRLAGERDEIRVVADQIGTPTYAADLAAVILTVIDRSEAGCFHPGLYHYSNEGVCSWYDFAVFILQAAGFGRCRVVPIETADFPAKARRPFYSVLNKSKIKHTYGLGIPHWSDSLARCLQALRK